MIMRGFHLITVTTWVGEKHRKTGVMREKKRGGTTRKIERDERRVRERAGEGGRAGGGGGGMERDERRDIHIDIQRNRREDKVHRGHFRYLVK